MFMALKKASIAIDKSVNTKWLNNAMKSIGISSKNVLKDIAPSIYEITSSTAQTSKDVVNTIKHSGGVERVTDTLKNNKYVGFATTAYKNILSDLASGNFNNEERAMNAYFGDDSSSDSDSYEFSFGNDDSSPSESPTVQFVDTGAKDVIQSGLATLDMRMTKNTEAQIKASKASMDAFIAVSSASMFQSQKIGTEIVSHLSNISNSLEAITQYNNENMTKFIDASLAYYEKMGKQYAEKDETTLGSGRDATSILLKTDTGGISFSAYKDYVTKQAKSVFKGSSVGMVASLIDDDMIKMMISNPLGAASEGLIKWLMPKMMMNTIQSAEAAVSAFVPNMLSQIADWGDIQAVSLTDNIKKYAGKIFGVRQDRTTSFNKSALVEKGPVPFDGVTKHAITEIITKELREQTGYLKAIAQHFKINTDEILANTKIFNYNTGTYQTQQQVTDNVLNDIRNARINTMGEGRFGQAVKKVTYNSALNEEERNAMTNMMEEFFLKLEKRGKTIKLDDDSEGSDINKLLASLNGDERLKRLFSNHVKGIAKTDKVAAMDVGRSIMSASASNNRMMQMIQNDPYYYNLFSANIDGNIDDILLNKYKSNENTTISKNRYKKLKKAYSDEAELMKSLKDNETYDMTSFLSKFSGFKDTFKDMTSRASSGLNGMFGGIIHGNASEAFTQFTDMARDQIVLMGKSVKDNFLVPLKISLFGEKDSDGYSRGGIISSVSNVFEDSANIIKWHFTGKGFTDSKGEVHEDKEDTVFSGIKKVGTTIKESVMVKLFGEEAAEKSILENVKDTFSKGLQGWSEALFGKTDKDGKPVDHEEIKKQITEYTEKAIPNAVAGGTLGAIGGLSAGGILGTLVGGPIGGAVMGSAIGFVSKSEKFQNFVFGEKDGEERTGGLISKNIQKFAKENDRFLIGSTVIGAGAGAITGGGILGTLVGGPVAGALMGLATGVVAKSNMFHEFLFGSEKSGQLGVVNIIKNLFKKSGEAQEEASIGSIGAKALGMAGIGAGAGAITAGLLSNVGVLGAALTPFGPVGGAIAGLGLAITAQKDRFHDWMFGTTDEDGNKKEGILGQFKVMLMSNVLNPIKNKLTDMGEEAAFVLKHDILRKIELSIEPLAEAVKSVVSPIVDKIKDGFNKLGDNLKDFVFDPIVDNVRDYIVTPLRVVIGSATDIFFKLTKRIITAPINMIYKLTSPLVQGIAKMTKKAVTTVSDGIHNFVIKPLHNFFVKPLINVTKGLTKGLLKVISAPFNFIAGAANYINDKRLGVGKKEDRELKDHSGEDNSKNSTRRKWANEDKKTELINLKKHQAERKYRNKNEQMIAKATGNQRYEDTEENRRLAELALGKKINWHGIDTQKDKSAKAADGTKIEDLVSNPNKQDLDVESRQLIEMHTIATVAENIFNLISKKFPGKSNNDVNADDSKENQTNNTETDNKGDSKDVSPKNERTTKAREVANDIAEAGGIRSYLRRNTSDFFSTGINVAKDRIDTVKEGMSSLLSKFHIRGFADGTDNAPNDVIAVGENGPELMQTKGGEKIYSNAKPIKVHVVGIASGLFSSLGKIGSGFKGLFSKRDDNTDGETDSVDAREIASKSKDGTAVLNTLHGDNPNTEEKREQLEDDAKAVIENAQNKEEREKAVSAGTSVEEKKAELEKERENARNDDIQNNIQEQTKTQKSFTSMWESIFSKKGLITGGLLLAAPYIFKFLKNFNIGNIISGVSSHILNSLGFVAKNGGLGDGNSVVDKIGENLNDVTNIADAVVKGDTKRALSEYLLNDEYQADHQTDARGKFLTKTFSRGTSRIVGVGQNLLNAKHELDNAFNQTIVSQIDEVAEAGAKEATKKGGFFSVLFKDAKKTGSASLIDYGKDLTKSSWNNLLGKTAKTQADDVAEAGVKTAAQIAKSSSDNVISKVVGYVSKFADDIVKAVSKKSGKKIAKTGISKFISKISKCISSNFTLISGKISAILGVTAGLATTGIGLLAKEATWITLGAINGLTGAARLFRVDRSHVDGWMTMISSALGAFAGTTIGSIVDVVNELVVSVFGIDFFTELATLIYRILAGSENYTELTEGQSAFQAKYTKYQNEVLKEQYNTMVKAGILNASDVSESAYIDGAKKGIYTSEYDSFADYNDKQHNSLGALVMGGVGDAAGWVVDRAKDIGGFFFGEAKTTITDDAGNTYTKNKNGTYQVTSVDGEDLGYISADTFKDVKTTSSTTRTKNIFGKTGDILKTGFTKAANVATKAATTFVDGVIKFETARDKFHNSIKRGIRNFFLDSKEYAWFDENGGYYVSTGKSFNYYNGQGELIQENLDADAITTMIGSGVLTQGEKRVKSGLKQIIDKVGATITSTAKKAWNGAQNIAHKTVTGLVKFEAARKAFFDNVKTNVKNFFVAHDENAWFDEKGGYYISNKDGTYSYYTGNGTKVSDKLEGEPINAMINSGMFEPGKARVKSGAGQLLSDLGDTITKTAVKNIKSSIGVVLKAAEIGKSAVDSTKRFVIGKIDSIGTALVGKTTTGFYEVHGTGYYASVGGKFNYYNQHGDLISEGIDPSEIAMMMDNGLLTEKEVRIDSTIKTTIDKIGNTTKTAIVNIAGTAIDLWQTAQEAGTKVLSTVKDLALYGTPLKYFVSKSTKVWYDPSGNYYKKEGSSWSYYNTNNDLIVSGIPEEDIEDKKLTGFIQEGDLKTDPIGKKAIDKIYSAVKNAWSTASTVVASGWSNFTKWLGGGSGGHGTHPSNISTYGQNSFPNITDIPSFNHTNGKGGGFGGGHGDESSKLNGYPYYSQNDSRWRDMPYTKKDGSDSSATMATSGCGPTAFSMIASKFHGKDISPVEMANYAKTTGFRDDTGTNWGFIDAAANTYGIESSSSFNPSSEFIASELSRGKPMILSGTDDGRLSKSPYTSAGHYVVATGIDKSGNVSINDPRGKSYSNKIKVNQIASQTGAAWSFGGNGKKHTPKSIKNIFKRGGHGVTLGECREAVVGWMLSIMNRNQYTQSTKRELVTQGVAGYGYGDCSSTCWKIYETALGNDFQIGTYTGNQYNNSLGKQIGSTNTSMGTYPPVENLLPGDCIYYYAKGSSGKVGHVEMYLGNGYIAGHGSGLGPKVSKINEYNDARVASGYGTWMKVIRFIRNETLYKVSLRKPQPALYKIQNTFTDGRGNNSKSMKSILASTTGSDSSNNSTSSDVATEIIPSTSVETTSRPRGTMETILGFFSEMGSRALDGLLSGKWNSDYTDYFGNISDTTSNDTNSTNNQTTTTGDTSAASSTNLNNEQKIWKFFKDRGIPSAGIAGMMGNLYWESALNPKNLQNTTNKALGITDDQFTDYVDSGAYDRHKFIYPTGKTSGYGLAQWTYSTRKAGLYDYIKGTKGKSIGDMNSQLEYLWQELNTGEHKGTLNAMRTGSSVRDVSNYILKNFERPADQGLTVQNQRAESGQGYYNKYKDWNGGSGDGKASVTRLNTSKPIVSGGEGGNLSQTTYSSNGIYKPDTNETSKNKKVVNISAMTGSGNGAIEGYLANMVVLLTEIAGNTLTASQKLELLEKLKTYGGNNLTLVQGGNTNNVVTSGSNVSSKTVSKQPSRNALLAAKIASGI